MIPLYGCFALAINTNCNTSYWTVKVKLSSQYLQIGFERESEAIQLTNQTTPRITPAKLAKDSILVTTFNWALKTIFKTSLVYLDRI